MRLRDETIPVAGDRHDPSLTRRRMLGDLAKVSVGGAAALAALTAPAALGGRAAGATGMTDIDILNYALTLEHLENAFYRDGIAILGEVVDFISLIAEHERVHVETLVGVIQSLGGSPVQEQCYVFDYSSAGAFLATAQLLENTGVMAYDGAIALIQDPALQTAGATIATVEARHASYLNLVNGAVPFPDAFDTASPMSEILAAASGFFCR